jgi:hypothetical protein
MTHSAGPWRVGDPHIATGSFRGESLKSTVSGETLAIVLCGPNADENGRLMAAAPELAAALGGLLWQCRQMASMFPDDDKTIYDAMEDAEKVLSQVYKRSP